jgi:hypothetical protein
MRLFWAMVAIVFLTMPAFSQAAEDPADFIKKRDAKELDEQYKSAVKGIPTKNEKIDPWGNVRSQPEPDAAKIDPVKKKNKSN